MPEYQTSGSACADIFALESGCLPSKKVTIVKTGLSVEIPEGYEIQIRPRSGLALKCGITVYNTPGCIDSDYRDEIGVVLYNSTDEDYFVSNGDRVAQMCVVPVFKAEFEETNFLGETKRAGGFGSTGK